MQIRCFHENCRRDVALTAPVPQPFTTCNACEAKHIFLKQRFSNFFSTLSPGRAAAWIVKKKKHFLTLIVPASPSWCDTLGEGIENQRPWTSSLRISSRHTFLLFNELIERNVVLFPPNFFSVNGINCFLVTFITVRLKQMQKPPLIIV